MTNAELIQKIRKEIINRIDKRHLSEQAKNELVSILSFLSTLESEKPMNPSERRDPCGLRGPSGVDGDKNWYLLDQEIIDWCGKFSPSIREEIQSTAYHFADWQKEQMMKDGNVILTEEDFDAEKEKSMEWGYNLCKEQMLKEAVEGEVVKDINNKLAVTAKNVNLDKFKFGDKVRIIIVKEEEK